ncbi:MAG: DnaD domain protein [Lachnospiraceae bacterium]|nr:DnaD domain protein [Lachnospiraceae bacterium]
MADISLKVSGLSVTCVSNAFIDQYMAQATGEYVKIYIYLLRCLEQEGEAFSVQKIASKLGHTGLDVKRAFDYWEQQGMIRQERDTFGELTGICVLDPFTQGYDQTAHMSADRPITISAAAGSKKTKREKAAAPAAAPVEEVRVAETRPMDDEAFSELLFLAETYSGHTLSPKDIDRILFWYDGLGMSAELVEYLITYCADKGHGSLSYMNKIAVSWADAGISTVEEAKAETSRHSEIYYAVCTGFGISGRNLSPGEMDYVRKWQKLFSDTDIIREACERTVLKTGKIAFGYADKIISDWHARGVADMSDIAAYDQAFTEKAASKQRRQPVGHKLQPRDSFHNFTERDYEDMEAIEAKLLASGRR